MPNLNLKSVVITPEMLAPLGLAPQRERIMNATDAYARVPLIYHATKKYCNALTKIPFYVYKGATGTTEATENDLPIEITRTGMRRKLNVRNLIWHTRAAGLLAGASYIVKRRTGRRITEIQWVNPITMRVEKEDGGALHFVQNLDGREYGAWTIDDMVYIPEFSLRTDYLPGDCPAVNALGNAQLSFYITRVATKFFEDGAMPVTLLTSEDGFGADTEKVENWFAQRMQGIRNAFRVLAVRGRGIGVNQIQSPMKDLALQELRDQARKDIALAFGIPVTLLDDDANYATAETHKKAFYDDTILPDADLFADELNAQLFEPLGLRLEFHPEQMDMYQEDEVAAAQAASTFTNMLSAMPDYETFEFVALTYGIEYDEAKARAVFANKDARKEEMQAQTPQPTNAPQAAKYNENHDPTNGQFTSGGALEGDKISGALRNKGLTPYETQAMRDYQQEDYQWINDGLRYGTGGDESEQRSINRRTSQIDSAISKGETTSNILVWRGVSSFSHKVGDEYTDRGYVSTTSRFDDTGTFGQTKLKITIPAGTHLFDFSGHSMFAHHGDEHEILLGRDGKFRVDSYDHRNNVFHITMLSEHSRYSADSKKALTAMLSDLDRWKRAASKRITRGGDLNFHSDAIPPTLKASILGALQGATDAASVRRIFNDAQRWKAYP